jgi:hypothetical protein
MTGVAKHTFLKLLEDLGCASAGFHHRHVRGLKARRIQCDEIWQFVGAKQKNATPEQKAAGWGDAWTWVALDVDTELCISYLVGGRDTGWATGFAFDIRQRVVGRSQKTTETHRPYLASVEMAFGEDVDYAQMHKVYGASGDVEGALFTCDLHWSDMKTVKGEPDDQHVSASLVERHNLTTKMSMRRLTRLTNGFSKKIENHGHAIALHFMHYNFCRVHKTLGFTPAMEAGLSDHVWTIEGLILRLLTPSAIEDAA